MVWCDCVLNVENVINISKGSVGDILSINCFASTLFPLCSMFFLLISSLIEEYYNKTDAHIDIDTYIPTHII